MNVQGHYRKDIYTKDDKMCKYKIQAYPNSISFEYN